MFGLWESGLMSVMTANDSGREATGTDRADVR